jgi:multisubunit Na+/H+ antiporter MnhG subunit
MSIRSLNFWTLIIVSILLSVLAISVFFWFIRTVFIFLLVLLLTPVIYLVLRRMARPRLLTKDDEKLKNRQ